jgi:hypothetical protein
MSTRHPVKHHGLTGGHGPNGGRLYTSLPVELARDAQLSHVARSVALYVWSHDEKFQQSTYDVAESLGTARNTVRKALAELQERGWFVRERTAQNSERWHLQMTNRPFTADEVRELSGTPGHRLTRSDQPDTGSRIDPVMTDRVRVEPPTGSRIDPVTGSGIDPHSSERGVHLEVHDSSSATKGDEVTRSYPDPFVGRPVGLPLPEEPEQASSGDDGEDDRAKGWVSPLEWECLSNRNPREVSADFSGYPDPFAEGYGSVTDVTGAAR